MKRLLLLAVLVPSFFQSGSQTPDWSTSIASIIYDNCSECHHEGGIGPMSLMSYDDAVTYSFPIQSQVNAKLMPPWPADPEYRHFWDEKVLSELEIEGINAWIDGGMPAGDMDEAPPPPLFNGGVSMVNPDDTIILPTFIVPYDEDVFWTFVVPSGYNGTRYINEIEFVPGNPAIVHHVIYNQDTSDEAVILDDSYPGPGYPNLGFGNPTNSSINWGGWTPGKGIMKWPPNMAFEIIPESYFIISMHYAPNNMGALDSSRIYLKYAEVPDSQVRRVYQQRYLIHTPPSLMNPPFHLYANTIDTFHEKSEIFTSSKSLLGISPHSHYLCQTWEVFMVEDNGDTTKLIYIPNWDFDWQYNYLLTKVMKIPPLSQLFGRAVFDNTVNNPDNPNNPPEDVHTGEKSTQEMMNCRFWLMDYMPGDEYIILDSAFYGIPTGASPEPDHLLSLNVFPNPADDLLMITADLQSLEVSYRLMNAAGEVLKEVIRQGVSRGVFVEHVETAHLPPGIYLLSFWSAGLYDSRKVIISR